MRRRGDAGPEKLLAITSGDVETSYRLLWAGVVLLTMALCFVGGEFFLRAVSGNELEYVLSEPDAEFLQRFDTGELAFAEWTHEAHCRLAFVLYRHHQYDQTAALQAIRAEILKFNQAHRERLTVGYHETLTTFWALAVFMGEDSRPRRLDFASFWVPPVRAILSNTNLWQTFYSAERMWNGNAATTVVPPDRQPLSGLISTFRSAGSSQLTE